jgi:predicted Zn-dependent protease
LIVVALIGLSLISGGCISDEKEREIGSTMASEVNPHLPILQNPLLNEYIYRIGRQMGRVSGRPDLDYRFYIVNTDVVNAFALPGGHIYVTRGLIEHTRTAPEFAGAIAHEVGHVAARHGIRQLQRELRTGSLVNVLYNAILGGEPALLRDNSLQLASVVWTAEHSRRDEREADRLAVEYLQESGVDPQGVVTLLESILRDDGRGTDEYGRLETLLSTHPLTRNRIAEAERNIDRLDAGNTANAAIDLASFTTFRTLVVRSAPQLMDSIQP